MAFDLATELSQLINEPEPKKAALHCLDRPHWGIPEVQFNPQSLSLSRQAGWATGNEALAPWSSLSYTRGQPDSLSFTLLLDQTHYEPESTAGVVGLALLPTTGGLIEEMIADSEGFSNDQSVTAALSRLYRLTLPVETPTGNAGGRMRPPVVIFEWGDLQFTGVLESVGFELTLFDLEGRPRRATAACSMKGRALQRSASPDAFFGVEYDAPPGNLLWVDPSPALDPTDDSRLDILSKLLRD